MANEAACLKQRKRTSSPNDNKVSPRRDISSLNIRLMSSMLQTHHTVAA